MTFEAIITEYAKCKVNTIIIKSYSAQDIYKFTLNSLNTLEKKIIPTVSPGVATFYIVQLAYPTETLSKSSLKKYLLGSC